MCDKDMQKLTSVRTTRCQNPLIPHCISWKVDQLRERIVKHLENMLAREPKSAVLHDWFQANVYALRDRILEQFIKTQQAQHDQNCRRVYYMSMEYLMGRLLRDNLNNCQLYKLNENALIELGLKFEAIEEQESDMGLGNGGLGRLAACIMDALSTHNYPAVGYGIHYEFGMFRQEIQDFRQKELADNWLLYGNPWQIMRSENTQTIPIYGHVETRTDASGKVRNIWVNYSTLRGVPWDIPVVGYGAQTVNFLRLWESRASEEFNLDHFNQGNFLEAVESKAESETISRVLYPNDASDAGKKLRLVQQYFFASCSLKDIIRRHFNGNNTWDNFADKVCIQLNDTHPTIAIVEFMRILIDEQQFEWEKAWEISSRVFNYTNHTLLPEALEKWSVRLFEYVLPRHLQIIYEINGHFLKMVEKQWPGDVEKLRSLSIIEEGGERFIRMAYLAVVGSESVNGVAAMHSQLVKTSLFPEFVPLFENKFKNVTNGVTPRRWINSANPRLAELLNKTIGEQWILELDDLKKLEPYANDLEFRNEFARIKIQNKNSLASYIKKRCGISLDVSAIFDSQIKRIHEYKRQHLKLMHILYLYQRILEKPSLEIPKRVFIFAGKSAPGYIMAKTIIHAINLVADYINNDSRIQDRIKVVFIPNYDVSSAMKIIPATDLSEQISTAGTEASGTSNMKFAMNGALTIGTLDGANVEILEQVKERNMFIFGHTAPQLAQLAKSGYSPEAFYHHDEDLKKVLDWMMGDTFGEPHGFNPLKRIAENLLYEGDRFFILADFQKYIAAQNLVSDTYENSELWYSMAILNVANMGKFSSDRTVKDYAENIWNLRQIQVT
ncbi:MAG: glycogen/starch/alpha-glucan phosphorylase [Puniceicoccales bacterium]|jgi:starch phosphorylase|nr:glycogen/starch/alpha-glucan phosphorylase [Puniceicoccales bacterium]